MNAALVSSMDVVKATAIPYRMLDYWCRAGVIAPTVESTGSGVPRRWSTDDVAALHAIAAVSEDLRVLGLDMPVELVGRVWDLMKLDGVVRVASGTVTIAVG